MKRQSMALPVFAAGCAAVMLVVLLLSGTAARPKRSIGESTHPGEFTQGQAVYGKTHRRQRARIVGVNGDGTYTLLYADNDVQQGVPASKIEARVAGEESCGILAGRCSQFEYCDRGGWFLNACARCEIDDCSVNTSPRFDECMLDIVATPVCGPDAVTVADVDREALQQLESCDGKQLGQKGGATADVDDTRQIHELQRRAREDITGRDYWAMERGVAFEVSFQNHPGQVNRDEVLDNHNAYWGKLYKTGSDFVRQVGGHTTSFAVWQRIFDEERSPDMSLTLNAGHNFQDLNNFHWHGSVLRAPEDMFDMGLRQLLLRKVGVELQRMGFGFQQDGIFVETGAGWGRNIFYLLNHGFTPSPLARFYMAEFSSSGRAVARLLADLRSTETADNPVFVGPFDYNAPGQFEFCL